jgi:sugar/nucleoside kinase (ribokinase family)
MRVCTLGDLLLDVSVRLRRPLAPGGDAPAETRVGPGGQAANVASWVAALGGVARFVGKRGDDDAGMLVAARLNALGVEVVGPVVAGRTGVVVALVDPGGERTMAADRGVATQLAPDELDETWFADCDWLHLSGYALTAEPVSEASAFASAAARKAGGRISIDLASWSAVRDAGAAQVRARIENLAPDVIFANEREEETVGPLFAPTRVLKRGDLGCSVESDGERIDLPAIPAEVVDTTGAGDAFVAGFLLGGTLEDAAQRGLAAAARGVAQLGAAP